MNNPMKIGIIGCGNISRAYFEGAQKALNLEIKACADLRMEAALEKAEAYKVEALTVEDLLADSEIELIVNLTLPQAHVPVGLAALEAGKHVYCEKPLALSVNEGQSLLDVAATRGLRVGCAPDTFLFKGSQTARKLLDDGWIGRPVSGTAFMNCHGHESWHPNPGFYYEPGGGPLLDMGPYYITALVNLLGPVRSVMARCGRAHDERLATSAGAKGRVLPVSVDTHCAGILEFDSGVIVSMITSFDVWKHNLPNLTLHGTEGSLEVGDPNNFKVPPRLFRPEDGEQREIPFTHADNQRMIGVVDMVDAIRGDRPHRASGALALYVLEVMLAFDLSSKSGSSIPITRRIERPEALRTGLPAWQV
jgi:predicted dehydrogenase